jgi:oligosaccharyltransferase complex subunit alpha (ribophorin I)
LGYNLPTAPYLATEYSDSNKYVLTVPFLADWEFGVAIDIQVLKIVLPEGARDISVDVPFEVDSKSIDDHFVTYLDVGSGRPVVVITKRNLVNDHNQNFQVRYYFPKSMMAFEPLLLISGFLVFFFIIIFILRIELTISDEVKVTRIEDERVIKILENISEIYRNRGALHLQLSEHLNNYIKTSDEKTWEKERRAAIAQFSEWKKKVGSELNELSARGDSGEYVGKIQEIEKKQVEREAIQQQLHDVLIKYKVKKAVPKSDHESERDQLTTSYEAKESEIDEEVEEFLGAF